MKRTSGLLMLIVVALLVSMPVSADVYEAPNSLNMIVTAADETKIMLQEEVVGNPGETMAVQSVEPITAVTHTVTNMVCPDAGIEAALLPYSRVYRMSGGGRIYSGHS